MSASSRQACLVVAVLPLQLVLRRHPDWAEEPVAVVNATTPGGIVSWSNETARRLGVRTGLRFAAALGLCSGLRAATVEEHEILASVELLAERLRRFTPGVEPCADEPGVFWLDGRGLQGLYRTPAVWLAAMQDEVCAAGFRAALVCGYGRFATYALAKALAGAAPGGARRVLASREDESAALQQVRLDRTGIEPAARDALAQLGIRTIGAFVGLPAAGLRRRFGAATERLHRMATGDLDLPPQPPPEPERFVVATDLEVPECDIERLVFRIKQSLDPLLTRVALRGRVLVRLDLRFELESSQRLVQEIRPAAPTLDVVQILGLLRLRLEAAPPPAAVTAIELEIESAPARHQQESLFAVRPKRDRAAAARALARLRATFGDESVVRARLVDGHLPEAQFRWEAVAAASAAVTPTPAPAPTPTPTPTPAPCRVLVRRLFAKPVPLPPRPPREPDGWLLRGLEHGPVARFIGPYLVSGGWWRREVQRDYYIAEMRAGDLLWIYYDRRRRRWFQHGIVS